MLPRKEQIKKYFNYAIIIGLIIIIFLMYTCKGNSFISSPDPKIETRYDTVFKHITDTVQHDVHIKDIVYVKSDGEPQYTYNDTFCKQRFNNLVKEFLRKTTYEDTLRIDSVGYVIIVDTVFKNKLGERLYFKDLHIPTVTKTVTITKQADPKRQLYVGGNLFGNSSELQLVAPGLIYKDKKDRVYQVNCGINNQGNIYYGAGMYWKIKLHK